MTTPCRRIRLAATLLLIVVAGVAGAQPFVTFESGQVRPLALSGSQLFAVNTPDNRLEVFSVSPGGLTHTASVPVGLEPVAVAARTSTEVWVVNHLSDSVSIVDLSLTPPRVVRTLLVGDEPRDIVFAGSTGDRAFITTAHRGQNSPVDPQLSTAGVDRADVWIFDATALGSSLGGDPIEILTLFGDTPRALAVAPGGTIVYAAVFHSGNQTTTINEGLVCNGGAAAPACNGGASPGGLPAPNTNFQGTPQPEVGLIVKFDGTKWVDELGRDWTGDVRFSLPDLDVFRISAAAPSPSVVSSYAHVGTVLFNMVVNPSSGKVYVSNTEARNEVRFEGPGTFAGKPTVRGHLAESRITVLDGTSVLPRHLNKHIGYSVIPSPAGTKEKSLATPTGMAVNSTGTTLYVAAFGSSAVGIFNTGQLEGDTFTPSASDHIPLTGGGPSGLALDEANNRLYVLTRFDNAVVSVNLANKMELQHLALHNPEPASVVNGRPVLYDAVATSSNGEAACASCHIFGDFDSLAWDLGNPDDMVLNNPNPIEFNIGQDPDFHPLKGPMTTQSLRGMANHGPMHWRGDRTGGNDPGGDPLAEDQAFKKFIGAFDGLLGRGAPISAADMQKFTDFILQVTYPPNPIRPLDNQLVGDALLGRSLYNGRITDGVRNCNGCHTLAAFAGFFGSDGDTSFENETQLLKIPHLRNMYQKVGMFGLPNVPFINPGDNGNKGIQVRGFGFLHDGSIDTLFRFHRATVFSIDDTENTQLEAFMFQFDTNLPPIMGQQATVGGATSNATPTVSARLNLILARAVAGECDVIVKGTRKHPTTLVDEARGWVRLGNGSFRSDRVADAPIAEATLRGEATTAHQERTYTCVPVGSGQRLGVDRDLDGFLDQDEVDAGSDPSDPASTPGASTTTTTTVTTTTTTSTTTTTLPVAAVVVPTQRLALADDSVPPIKLGVRRFSFTSSTRLAPQANRIVLPPFDSGADPTAGGGAYLTVYNSSGLTTDAIAVILPAGQWKRVGTAANPRSYKFKGNDPNGPITSVLVRPDRLTIRGGKANWTYTLGEPAQGQVAVHLTLGNGVPWCANPPAKTDRSDKYVAQPRSPTPVSCPPVP